MPHPPNLDQELRQHAGALRCIARDLLRDPHVADDVTQQTLHQALSQRDLKAGPMGGWLQRVLVNFVHQWRRGERRRLAREARVELPAPEPCPAEALMRRESLQAVTAAVLQIEEPFQTAIFLRYFEDLPPRAIAKQTGASIATVKSRLQRGLAMLRHRLDQRFDQRFDQQRGGTHRDWRRALAATFGLPAITAAGLTVTTGAWILGTSTKVLFAAGLLCIGGLFAYRLTDDPALQQGAVTRSPGDSGTSLVSGPAGNDATAAERESPPQFAPIEPWLDHPFLLELEVLVVDPTGLPVEGQTPQLAPGRIACNTAPAATGPDGRTVIAWRSRLPQGEVVLSDEHGTLRRVLVQHGTRTIVALPGAAAIADTFVLTARDVSAIEPREPSLDPVRVHYTIPLIGSFYQTQTGGTPAMQAGLHPHAVFTDPSAQVQEHDQDIAIFSSSWLAGRSAHHVNVSLSETLIVLGQMKSDVVGQPAPPTVGVTGIVFGDDGKPAAGVPIALLGTSKQPLHRTASNEEGRFAFDNLVEGSFTVRAGGGPDGMATVPVVVTAGMTPTQLSLRRDACVRGRVVTKNGQPIAKARVVWRAADGSSCDQTETGEDGTFVVANLAAVAGTVAVWTADGSPPLPIAFAAGVLPDTGDLLLRHDAETGRALQVELLLPAGCEDAAIEVRVWQIDTGLGTTMPVPETGTPWRLERLPPGWYQVEVRANGAGHADLGRHWLDGKADCDLGRVNLPTPGRARFVVPATALPESAELHSFEVCQLRRDVDVRVDLTPVPLDQPILLPAGDYVFAFGHRDGRTRFHRFTVRAGEETLVSAMG